MEHSTTIGTVFPSFTKSMLAMYRHCRDAWKKLPLNDFMWAESVWSTESLPISLVA